MSFYQYIINKIKQKIVRFKKKLLDKISDLLIEDKKRVAMATQGLKTIVKYDWKQVGKLYLDIYESLLD